MCWEILLKFFFFGINWGVHEKRPFTHPTETKSSPGTVGVDVQAAHEERIGERHLDSADHSLQTLLDGK